MTLSEMPDLNYSLTHHIHQTWLRVTSFHFLKKGKLFPWSV